MAGQENQQYTVLYGRLSQEDERAGESNSIQHQRTLLEKYAKEKGFENTIFLADDGYSGTNFERPSWKKIVEMIESGQVANLIVKDASRLGREYLQVGYYMEIYFPQKNVRFIAVNDGVDSTVESSNDFNPIRNWANELHAKDTSRKVRAVMKMKAEQGERLGGRPPYGYRKSDGDANTLVPDEDTAPVVKRIFSLCAAGNGPKRIATILTKEQVVNHVKEIYTPFTEEEISDKIAEMVRDEHLNAEVKVVFQSVEDLHVACPNDTGDWYFTGNYPTPGGNKVVNTAYINWVEGRNERSY